MVVSINTPPPPNVPDTRGKGFDLNIYMEPGNSGAKLAR